MRDDVNTLNLRQLVFLFLVLSLAIPEAAAEDIIRDGGVTERHVMLPMRDGKHLSAWLYLPPGDGPWPVVFEQRYANDPGRHHSGFAIQRPEPFCRQHQRGRGLWRSAFRK